MIGIFGDIMLDKYTFTDTCRISPEAPVPALTFLKNSYRLGGAANVALNLLNIGANCKLLSVCGDDANGVILKKLLNEVNINCKIKTSKEIPTTTKERIISSNQHIVRIDYERKYEVHAITNQDLEVFLANLDMLVISDYNKHLQRYIPKLIKSARTKGIYVITDPKSKDPSIYKGTNLITPNNKELLDFFGLEKLPETKKYKELLENLSRNLSAENIVHTRGSSGITLYSLSSNSMLKLPAEAKSVSDVTGAGDSFLAALAFSKYSGSSIEQSVYIANSCASKVVSRFGTSSITEEEYTKEYLRHTKNEIDNSNCKDRNKDLTAIKKKHKVIGFTNGCFDLIHVGHLRLLEYAKQECDFLIVGLNSDKSVKRLKGNSRPINCELHRKEILEALKWVDRVIIFNETTPLETIKEIKPNVLIKGSDYEIENIIGKDIVLENGGKVLRFDLLNGLSTTKIIELINRSN